MIPPPTPTRSANQQLGLSALEKVLSSTQTKNIFMLPRVGGPPAIGGGAGPLNFNPLLASLASSCPPPRFSGQDEDWFTFSKEWEQYVHILSEMAGQDISDVLLLRLLHSSLDEVSRTKLQARQERNPGLTIAEFWKELQRTYARDDAERHRREWELLSLRHLKQLTLKDLRAFQVKFDLLLGRLGRVGDAEVADRFSRALPLKYQEEIFHENQNRSRHHFWVRFPKPCPLSRDEIWGWIAEISAGNPRIDDREADLWVDCGSERTQEVILSCDGSPVKGQILRVFKETRKMGYPEMSSWLLERLRVAEEFASMRGADTWQVRSDPAPPVASSSSSSTAAVAATSKGGGTGGKRGKSPERAQTPPRDQSSSDGTEVGSKGKKGKSKGKSKGASAPPSAPPVAHAPQAAPASKQQAQPPAQPTSSYSSGSKGHGVVKGASQDFNAFRDCRACWAANRDYRHDWRNCEIAKELAKLKQAHDEKEKASGKSGSGRGRGKP